MLGRRSVPDWRAEKRLFGSDDSLLDEELAIGIICQGSRLRPFARVMCHFTVADEGHLDGVWSQRKVDSYDSGCLMRVREMKRSRQRVLTRL